jgi:predicted ester cyclase
VIHASTRRSLLAAGFVLPATMSIAATDAASNGPPQRAETPHAATLAQCAVHFSDPARREEYFRLYAPDVLLHRSPPLAPGLDAVKGFYRAYWAAFPDIRLALGTTVEAGDLLACEFTVEGTHRSAFLGIPPTGKRMRIAGVTLLRFRGDQCIERWSQTDLVGMIKQLGATIAPG